MHIKGQLTLGENLGDLGGLEVAYAAYRRYVAKHGEPPVIDGLTGDQRFFIAYGYSWETKQREGALRSQLLTNPHSPAAYRVNGIVRNVDAWYKAFNVQPGDKLYLPPDQRVHIWGNRIGSVGGASVAPTPPFVEKTCPFSRSMGIGASILGGVIIHEIQDVGARHREPSRNCGSSGGQCRQAGLRRPGATTRRRWTARSSRATISGPM